MLTNRSRTILIVGDILAILAVSVIGYLMHYAGKEAFSLRWLSTFLPFCLGWALIAPFLRLYQAGTADRIGQIWWRAILAAFLAAPFAAWLRGLWLSAAIIPVFVTVLGATSALGMVLWRAAWAAFAGRKTAHG